METTYQENEEELIRRKEKRRVRLRLSTPPLVLLISMTLVDLLLYFLGFPAIASDLPLFFILAGMVLFFFGAFYDFGEKKYIQAMMQAKAKIDENEKTGINKEQLIMTLIYAGIGGLFIITGILFSYIV